MIIFYGPIGEKLEEERTKNSEAYMGKGERKHLCADCGIKP